MIISVYTSRDLLVRHTHACMTLLRIWVLLVLIRSAFSSQCYYHIGSSAVTAAGYGSNRAGTVMLVIEFGYGIQFATDSSHSLFQSRYDSTTGTYTAALTSYQILARHVLAHFQIEITSGVNAGILGLPFDPNGGCGETCVQFDPSSSNGQLRIQSSILNPHAPTKITYTPPPPSHPARFTVTNGGVLGDANNTFSCTCSPNPVNDFPYIASFIMTNSAGTVFAIVTFSGPGLAACSGVTPRASPWAWPDSNNALRYGTTMGTCALVLKSGSNEIWQGSCPVYSSYMASSGLASLYVYGVSVTGFCRSSDGAALTNTQLDNPLTRLKGWFDPNIFNPVLPLTSSVLLSQDDWRLPSRYGFIYNIATKQITRAIVRAPFAIRGAVAGFASWGREVVDITFFSLPPSAFSFGTSNGILQTLMGGYPGMLSSNYAAFVLSSVFISIDSGSIYSTLVSSLFKYTDATQVPDGTPGRSAYPSLIAFTSTVTPSDKLSQTITNTGFARAFPIVRYLHDATSAKELPGLRVLASFVSSLSSVQGVAGNLTYPRADDAFVAYLSCFADSTMPVFGQVVAMTTKTYTPFSVTFLQQSGILRVLFTEGNLHPVSLKTNRVLVVCNGQVRAITLYTIYTSQIDLIDPIGCLDDPITVALGQDFVEFQEFQTSYVPDAFATGSTLIAQLPSWTPVVATNLFIQMSSSGVRNLTVAFNQTIVSVTLSGISVTCGSASATLSNAAFSGVSFYATVSGCTFTAGAMFIAIKKYAIVFQSLANSRITALSATIPSYPIPVFGNLSNSFQTPTCSGSIVQVPVVPLNDTSLGVSVNYKFVCDNLVLNSSNTVFGQALVGWSITPVFSSCSFIATFGLTGQTVTIPVSPCLNRTISVVESYYEPLERAAYVRFGTNLTILGHTIVRSQFSAVCDGVAAVIQLVSVGNPAIVDRGTVLSPGPVLVLNISGCVLDLNTGLLNITIPSRSFFFSNHEFTQVTTTMGPRFLPAYSSRSCQVLNSSVHLNTLNLTTGNASLALNVVNITHAPDGCVHVVPAAASGASVLFYVKTVVNRPCNSQLNMGVKFGIPQTIDLSYGHCDDLPYFNLNPVVDYVFTGSINGRAYNADYGQGGSGGVTWVTNFAGLPNVDAMTAALYGGLKDSVGVPGLNLTAYCWSGKPTVNSINELSGFLKKRGYLQTNCQGDVSDFTVVIAFDRQFPRASGYNYNPRRPYGKYHENMTVPISPYRTAFSVLNIGYTQNGEFNSLGNVRFYSGDQAAGYFETNARFGPEDQFASASQAYDTGSYVHKTNGHLKMLIQRYCISPSQCRSRIAVVDADGALFGPSAVYSGATNDGQFGQFHAGELFGRLYNFTCPVSPLPNRPGLRIGANMEDRSYGNSPSFELGRKGCVDQKGQYILQGISIYDRNLTDAEVDFLLRRKPPNGTAAVTESILLGQHIQYNVTKQINVYWYPTELPWLFNQSAYPRYSLVADGRNETTSFTTAGAYSYTLTLDGQSIRSTDTIFSAGLKVNLVPREAPLTLKSLSVELPAFLNVSLISNINLYQIAAATNRIRQITVFASPTNTSFFVANGTTSNPVFMAATRAGNYSIGRDFIARWQFSGSLPARVDVLGVDFATIGAMDQAVIVPNVLDPSVITLVLKTPIVLPSSTVYSAIEDTLNFIDIRPAYSYSASGTPEICDAVILTSLARNGTFQLAPKNNGTGPVPITVDVLPLRFNSTTHRLLYNPDLDFDRADFFSVVYDCAITQSVPQNLTVQVTPVEDGPKTTTALNGSIVVSDPYTYPYVPLDVREVDTLEKSWSIDISMSTYSASFFNKSMANFLTVLSEDKVKFLRGIPLLVNPRIAFQIYGNHTLFNEVLRTIRFICGTPKQASLYILIQDEHQKGIGTGLIFTRTIDCQVATLGSASDPDTPNDFVVQPPGGANANLVDNITVLAVSLAFLPGIGLMIVICMFAAKNTFKKYKQGLDTGLKAADSLSKGDLKGAVSRGVELAKIAKG